MIVVWAHFFYSCNKKQRFLSHKKQQVYSSPFCHINQPCLRKQAPHHPRLSNTKQVTQTSQNSNTRRTLRVLRYLFMRLAVCAYVRIGWPYLEGPYIAPAWVGGFCELLRGRVRVRGDWVRGRSTSSVQSTASPTASGAPVGRRLTALL